MAVAAYADPKLRTARGERLGRQRIDRRRAQATLAWRAEIGERHRTGSRHVLVVNGLTLCRGFNDLFLPID